MSEGPKNALIHIEGKAADTFVKKVSRAVGGLFRPFQIVRVAKAEAEAALIKAQNDIEVSELQRRAMHRFIEEEAQHQENMEAIASKAVSMLTEGSNADAVDDDWITNFFDKSRIVSNEEMQGLWSRVLAGEVNKPGTFSRRTVNWLADLDRRDGELFTVLCRFCWQIGDLVPAIFSNEDPFYQAYGLNFGTLSHLENIGLIRFEALAGFAKRGLPKHCVVHYYGQPTFLAFQKDAGNALEIGQVLLTAIGKELAPIAGSKPVPDLVPYVHKRWGAIVKTEEEWLRARAASTAPALVGTPATSEPPPEPPANESKASDGS